jgi:prolyl-tRNA editing enzyme YbaK/EbsC (Cys-tRNA(Pro) deacylase)
VDEAVMGHEWVILGGGSRSLKVKADPRVLTVLPGAEVIEGLAFAAPES